ncbi:MAG: hypothetical protein R3E01_05815 [Pirellulaceae bacterium]|nr:hypothetical protein [Planctomycetales bacterium]
MTCSNPITTLLQRAGVSGSFARLCCILVAAGLASNSSADEPTRGPAGTPTTETTEERTNVDTTKPQGEAGPAVTMPGAGNLRSWRVVNAFVYDTHGDVEVLEDRIKLGAGKPGSALVIAQEVPKMDYELAIDAMRTGESSDIFCGITAPFHDTHFTLVIGGWGGSVIGISNVDHESAIENETTTSWDFVNDRWYRIRLRVTEESIEAWIDDERAVKLDPRHRELSIWWEQQPTRPLGIFTWKTSAAYCNASIKSVKDVASDKSGP